MAISTRTLRHALRSGNEIPPRRANDRALERVEGRGADTTSVIAIFINLFIAFVHLLVEIDGQESFYKNV